MTSKSTSFLERGGKLLIVAAILPIALSWWPVLAADAGLVIRTLERDGVPMRFVVPDQGRQLPGVLVAHGFGVSQQIMRAYGYTLAHAGYGVMLWDFDGHGASQSSSKPASGALRYPWFRLGLLLFPFLAGVLLAGIDRLLPIGQLDGIRVGGASAIGNAMFFGWLMMAYFPIVG